MERPPQDFLRPSTTHHVSAERQEALEVQAVRPWRLWFFGGTLVATVVFFGLALVAKTAPADGGVYGGQTVLSALGRLIGASDRGVQGAEDDRINALLLGVGGAGHDGPELADTILLASFRPSTGELGMISVPRDLLVTIPGYGIRKVNHVNAYAEQARVGSGPEKTAEFIGDLFDEEIPYAVKVDFRGFAEIIDAVGGVDVYVDRTFTDPSYPIDGMEDAVCNGGTAAEGEEVPAPTANCRYEVLTFSEGWTHMDGAMALKFARSRHGTNGEGSDFARAARQQKIILAVREKVLSSGTLFNPGRLRELATIITNRVSTNISLMDLLSLAKYADDISPEAIKLHVISNGSGLVYDTWNGGYGLLPYKKDWSDFKLLAKHIFESEIPLGSSTTSATTIVAPSTNSAQLRIRIENATATPGLAARVGEIFEGAGYTIVSTGNADAKQETTTLLDGTSGRRMTELLHIADYVGGTVLTNANGALIAGPDATITTDPLPTDVDLVIILGADNANRFPL